MTREAKVIALFVLAIVLACGLALANKENETLVGLAHARITLAQAVDAAERSAGGRATSAELEVERGKVVFRIAVATSKRRIVEVVVDAVDGTVRSRGGRPEAASPVFATRELQLPPPPGR